MKRTVTYSVLFCLVMALGIAPSVTAGDGVSVHTSADLYNRYIWRGLDIGGAPSMQPSLSFGYGGLEWGAWGAYTLSNEASGDDEIDFWLSYTRGFSSEASISILMTDYYFPNKGIGLFNFNNHDAIDVGAHLIEVGLSVTGGTSFPLTLSGYLNVYNDAGSNTYFQLEYPFTADVTSLNFFCGAAGGSTKSADYYGTDEFAVINVGVSAVRDLKVSETLTLPLTVSLIVNPKAELTYLQTGISF